MVDLDNIETDRILSGTSEWMDKELQKSLAAYPLECMETEYPHYQYSIESPDDLCEPSDQHPVFYGCFDWHSAVHSHWCLIRQLRLFESHPKRSEIIESIDRRFTEDAIEREAAYFEDNPNFEKPYGWAWLLRLTAELAMWDESPANRWAETLKPLEDTIRSLVETEFLTQDRPFRVGTHGNSAFALAFVLDYAETTNDNSLGDTAAETARRFYSDDTAYPIEYEPLGWDFISPALTEADLMRRVLDREEFSEWVDQFLPDVTKDQYRTVLDPIDVDRNPEDGIETHLIGLNIAKSWCLIGISESLDDHRYGDLFGNSAKRHVDSSLTAAFTDDYAGSHWLSSFVLYLVTRKEGGIAE